MVIWLRRNVAGAAVLLIVRAMMVPNQFRGVGWATHASRIPRERGAAFRVVVRATACALLGSVIAAHRPLVAGSSPAAIVGPIPAGSRQMIVVTTTGWDSIAGTLYRFARGSATEGWRPIGAPVAVVVGRTGLAWGAGLYVPAAGQRPAKHEGDGRSPAGVFRRGTAFGFGPVDSVGPLHVPYRQVSAATDCVDDTTSHYYNTLVDRDGVAHMDWSSAEHMREVDPGYQLGVFVNYNTAPRVPGRGSCIFLHIWKGPASPTDGCTALDAAKLSDVVHWLDAAADPVLVQLTRAEYQQHRGAWGLPALWPTS
jgi:zinc D-Ala-D-Ala dipeptidase